LHGTAQQSSNLQHTAERPKGWYAKDSLTKKTSCAGSISTLKRHAEKKHPELGLAQAHRNGPPALPHLTTAQKVIHLLGGTCSLSSLVEPEMAEFGQCSVPSRTQLTTVISSLLKLDKYLGLQNYLPRVFLSLKYDYEKELARQIAFGVSTDCWSGLPWAPKYSATKRN
jgi:hypothetical protein